MNPFFPQMPRSPQNLKSGRRPNRMVFSSKSAVFTRPSISFSWAKGSRPAKATASSTPLLGNHRLLHHPLQRRCPDSGKLQALMLFLKHSEGLHPLHLPPPTHTTTPHATLCDEPSSDLQLRTGFGVGTVLVNFLKTSCCSHDEREDLGQRWGNTGWHW